MTLKHVLALTLGVGALGLLIAVVVGGGDPAGSGMSGVGASSSQAGDGGAYGSDYASETAGGADSQGLVTESKEAAVGDAGEAVALQARRPDPARPDGARRGGRGDWSSRMEERIAQYDLNGDGALSPEEREAMLQAFRDRMTDRFDADGDGFVSVEEMLSGRRNMMLDSPRGDRIRARYDSDGDGVLSESEEAAMNAGFAEQDAERLSGMLERYDSDGDGEMSREETVAMQEQWVDRQRSFFDSVTEQYDADGDGMLNIDERDTARAEFSSQRERDRFIDRYDTNGDNQIDARDTERFVDSYGAKEPHADVNRDGVINMDDLTAYRDYVEALGAQDSP